MIQLIKKNIKLKNKIFLKSSFGHFQFFFIEKKFIIPTPITINYHNNLLFFQTVLGIVTLPVMKKSIFFFKKKNTLLITINFVKNKKSILNLYDKLIRLKIKGLLQGFKTSLHLKGVGFRALINNNTLILKLGFSHSINLPIPEKIKITSHTNLLIFSSIDANLLFQFVHFVKNYKTPEPYKGKGLLLKNEQIVYKEGKKSKK